MEPTDVNIVNMDTVQAYQALQAGQGDAASLNVPTFFDAKKRRHGTGCKPGRYGYSLCRYDCRKQKVTGWQI